MNEINGHKSYLDLMNVLSMVAVVYLHVNGCFWNYSADRTWASANVIESVMYFAVPCFFMISGANLLNYRERYDTKTFMRKRVQKTVIPFVFWSFVGVWFGIFIKTVNIHDLTFAYIMNGMFGTNPSFVSVFWFFIPLFYVYMSAPLFSAVEESKKKDVFIYLCVAGFIINVMYPFVSSRISWIPNNDRFRLSVCMGYVWWFLIGWLLHNFDLKKNTRRIIYILSIFGLMIHMGGTYILSRLDGGVNGTYKGYNNIPCILYSIGIFVFIKQVGPAIMKNKYIAGIINFLKKYTFGIYLIHWFVMTTMTNVFGVNTAPLKVRLLGPIVIIFISVVIISVLRKIPVLRHVVP